MLPLHEIKSKMMSDEDHHKSLLWLIYKCLLFNLSAIVFLSLFVDILQNTLQ